MVEPPPVGVNAPGPAPVPPPTLSDIASRLDDVQKKIIDLKPSFWKTTFADSLKIAIAAGATLWATYLTGRLNQDNILVAARANARTTETIKDLREVRIEWVKAKSAFQNYFINAEADGPLPVKGFVEADLSLLQRLETAFVPLEIGNQLEEFRAAAEKGKTQCEKAPNPSDRKAAAKAARQLLDQSVEKVNKEFDKALKGSL